MFLLDVSSFSIKYFETNSPGRMNDYEINVKHRFQARSVAGVEFISDKSNTMIWIMG